MIHHALRGLQDVLKKFYKRDEGLSAITCDISSNWSLLILNIFSPPENDTSERRGFLKERKITMDFTTIRAKRAYNEHLQLRYDLAVMNRMANIITFMMISLVCFIEYLRFMGN